MKLFVVLVSLFLVLAVNNCYGDDADDELPLAQECDQKACQLPNCRCSSTLIPGGLEARDTPQFVFFNFDDSVNIINIETYRRIFYNRHNSNGCKIGSTFFINHEYTNYQLVNELYRNGFEIGLRSISHRTPASYWSQITYEDMNLEFRDQRNQMAHFSNISIDHIVGMRIPFLQMAGNTSFQMMKGAGLVYDATWGTVSIINPGLWPYTLDYASTQECITPPCPTASFPGTWVFPMLAWNDLIGSPCIMLPACYYQPELYDEEAWFRLIVTNFERNYFGTRAPFGFYVSEWFLSSNPAIERAMIRFLDMINRMHDVFMVNDHDIIRWIQNPIPINKYRKRPCRVPEEAICSQPLTCGPLTANHTGISYWVSICAPSCPRVYPWLGNPLGL